MCDKAHYDKLNERVTSLEDIVDSMRSECRAGFADLGKALNDVGHDFGTRMNTLDSRIVEERVEWGKTFRKVVVLVTYTLITLALLAAGINIVDHYFPPKGGGQQTEKQKGE